MTHIYYFHVDKDDVYESIMNLEEIISEITDGISSLYRCTIKRTGKFESDQVAAIVEVVAVAKGHMVTQSVYYILGSPN